MSSSIKNILVSEIDTDTKGWQSKIYDTARLMSLFKTIEPCEPVIFYDVGFIVLMEYVNDIDNSMIGDDSIEIVKAMMEIDWLNDLFNQARESNCYQVQVEIDYQTKISTSLRVVKG